MARLCPSLLLLVATVALASSAVHAWGTPKVVRKFQDIPKSYVYVQQAVWFAMKEYNKASSDKFAFKVVEILKSQEQITDSLDYLIEAKIVRTTCKKVSGEHENCSEQQDPQMQKVGAQMAPSRPRLPSSTCLPVLRRRLPASAVGGSQDACGSPCPRARAPVHSSIFAFSSFLLRPRKEERVNI
ncbi:cystatin-13-like isoform X1 [Camelus ferus]|uniref:Cystatin-13-like isoform X1 n=1 Tax=Camelus ferus TaxID=419612 RepID=A0A8B8RI90_CAMFR|nr:cystatin-13-like isoform X1 [Camelus ferus]